MIIKTAIVDDEDSSAQTLDDYIKKFAEESGERFETARFTDGDELLVAYKPVFDIIFLDIQMRHLDGMSTAEFIRKLDKDVILIFVTNIAQYAIKGYSVDAFDFLVKPVSYLIFSKLLKRSVERIKKRHNHFLLTATDIGTVRLNLSEIIFIESFRNKMLIHTAGQTYAVSSTMLKLEKELSGKNFFRCNKSYLVNMAFVTAVKGNSAIVDTHNISIGRGNKKAFLEALNDYVRG